MLCFLLLGSITCAAQSDSYEDYYQIFPSDSVIVSIPRHANSFFYTKKANKGTTVQASPDTLNFVIKYKPNPGHIGLDTFQIVYFYPSQSTGDLVKKSKKVVIRTSSFILVDDIFTVFTDDQNKNLDVLLNDNIPDNDGKIVYLPTPSTSILEISSDSSSVVFKSNTKPVSEKLSYIVENNGLKERGFFTINVIDSSQNIENQVFQKFLVKNSSITFVHPYIIEASNYTTSNGSIDIIDNKITYTPNADWTGQDTLIITVNGGSKTHQFLFKVFDFAQPNILAFDDYVYALKNQAVSFDMLANDFTMVLGVEIEEQPEHGTLVKQGNGKYRYSPDAGFTGTDVLVYKACDLASNMCEFAVTTITISDFAPDNIYYLSTAKNSPIKVKYPFPTPGYKLTLIPSAYPKHGWPDAVDQKNLIYNPNQDKIGLDSMKVKYTLISNPSVFYIVKLYIDVFDISNSCYENCIWPGDNNNDGRIDMKDLTFVAPFIGQTGDPRSNPQNEYWVGQEGNDWDISKDNINLKHGDSDGDGLIAPSDTTLLSANYRNLHGIFVNKGINSLFLPFDLHTDKEYYYPGDEINISFTIGGETWPIRDLNGFTASFNFSEAFNDQSMSAEFKSSHWLSDNDQMLQMVKKAAVRNLDFGSARISGSGVAGYGEVAVIKGIVDDQLDGFRDDDDIYYAQIQINDGTLQLSDGTELRTAPQVFNIPIKVERNKGKDADKQVRIYPNPTQSAFEIATKNPDNIIKSVYVYSISGQNIISQDKLNQNKVALNLGKYPAGLYLVKTFTTTGVEVSKVEKL